MRTRLSSYPDCELERLANRFSCCRWSPSAYFIPNVIDDIDTMIKLGFELPRRNSHLRAFGQPHFEFDFKLGFNCFKPKHPERAVFSFREEPRTRTTPNCVTRIIRNIRNEVGLGVGGIASRTQPANRMRMIEHCIGLFVIQVRGGLNDCAVTKLHIHMKNREVSLEWKDLFRHFFRGKNFTATAPEPPLVTLTVTVSHNL